jgi:hypothetical protein
MTDTEKNGWLQIEYQALLTSGASVNESFFKLAQMSFVLNPALAVAYAYVLSQTGFNTFDRVAILIAIIALVYNTGAIATYFLLHRKLALLLARLIQIEDVSGTLLRYYFQQSCPPFYRRTVVDKILKRQPTLTSWRRVLVHWLTNFFFFLVIAGWFAALIYAGYQWPEIKSALTLHHM